MGPDQAPAMGPKPTPRLPPRRPASISRAPTAPRLVNERGGPDYEMGEVHDLPDVAVCGGECQCHNKYCPSATDQLRLTTVPDWLRTKPGADRCRIRGSDESALADA